MSAIPALSMIWTIAANPLRDAFAYGAAGFASFARSATPDAVAAVWQGTAIALVLGLCLRLAPRLQLNLGAAQRFAVWAAAFVIISILPFLPSLPLQARFGVDPPPGSSLPAQSIHSAFIQFGENWATGLAALWLVASLMRFAGLIRHSIHLRSVWSSAIPVAIDEHLRGLLAAASLTRRPTQLCTTLELDRPSVIGFFAPRILIPEWLFLQLTADELEHVILHEVEHLRRGDDWINLLQKFALVLFPLNPALIWVERCLCREREMACDEGVVRRTQAPRAYAASLANIAGRAIARGHVHALSLGAFERRSELARRISGLLARNPALHPVAAGSLVVVAASGLLAASLELARCPQLVAFVPDAPTVSAAHIHLPSPQSEGDRVYAQPVIASNLSGVRALQARAALPTKQLSSQRSIEPAPSSAQGVPLLQSMLRHGSSAISSLPETHSSGQNPIAGKVSVSGGQMQSAAEPQVVVFTTWEQIETRSSEPIADYDSSALQTGSNESKAAPQNSQPRGLATQITVTRLIFWIAPRTATSDAATTESKWPHATAPDSRQLLAPAPASGWLFFQL